MNLELLILISPILAFMIWIGLVWRRDARHHRKFMHRLDRLGAFRNRELKRAQIW